MTFVHGPDGVTFPDDKPAKLRFFLGFVDDLAPTRDGADQVLCLLCFVEVKCRTAKALHLVLIGFRPEKDYIVKIASAHAPMPARSWDDVRGIPVGNLHLHS